MNDLEVAQHMSEMREKSGNVHSKDPLVSFLYILMRDHLTAGDIENIMVNHVADAQSDCSFSNGWLANYAKDIASRLK